MAEKYFFRTIPFQLDRDVSGHSSVADSVVLVPPPGNDYKFYASIQGVSITGDGVAGLNKIAVDVNVVYSNSILQITPVILWGASGSTQTLKENYSLEALVSVIGTYNV